MDNELEIFEDKAEEIAKLRDYVFNETDDITITAVGILLKKLTDAINKLLPKEYYDKDLSSTLKEAIEVISKIPAPQINVSPQLKFDIQPLQTIAGKISEQNGTLIALIGKFNNNQNEQLVKLIITLVEKQISFLGREVKQFDYTEKLTGIEKAINNRPTEIKSKVTLYGNNGRIEEITTRIIK